MSTEFIFDPPIKEDQFLAAVERVGFKPDYTAEHATQGRSYPIGKDGKDGTWVWVGVNDDTKTVQCTTYGSNSSEVLDDIAEICDSTCYCEHDEGFDSLIEDGEHGSFFTITFGDDEGDGED